MEEEQFLDAEAHISGDNDKLSFRLICLMHMRKIMELCCSDWFGGYWSTKSSSKGSVSFTQKVYVNDPSAAFCNAINGLYDILWPYFDAEMQAFDTKYQLEYKQKCKELHGEAWAAEKIILVRKLFRHLSSFLKRKDYFAQKYIEA